MNAPSTSPPAPQDPGAPPETYQFLPPVRPPVSSLGAWRGRLGFLVGWAWRILAGTVFCFNAFILSYLTSIAAVGWSYRWMQALVLRGWWKRSRFRDLLSFQEFCDSLGRDAPVPRPRWFLQERVRQALAEPGPGRAPTGKLRTLVRLVRAPWHSLWLNFKIGVQGLFCTYLVIGWGCLLMWVSWEFGWLNSFNKGYEQAFIGPMTGILGSLVLIAALFYVPMAQVHQAATGEARAFFHFHFVWRLIRARLTAYVALAFLVLVLTLVLEGLRVAVLSDDFPGNREDLSTEEGLAFLRTYFFWCSAFLFVGLLLTRGLAAVIYRSAVLKVLALGWVSRKDLHPVLAGWLGRLDMVPLPLAAPTGVVRAVKVTGGWSYRRVLFALLFVIWLAFVVRFYVGYFLVANDFIGFFNHPLIQFPCFDHTPLELHNAGNL